MNPAIDVIIAVYNGSKYIEEAIASVQAQSWQNLNIILADDGSEDNTLSIVTRLGTQDKRIKILSLPHRGVSATLNDAIKFSDAEFVSFLDADDLWHERKLEKQMEELNRNRTTDICFCMVKEFDSFQNDHDPQTHAARTGPLKGYSKIAFLGKRTVFEKYGLFDEEVAIGDFVDWFSRIVRSGQAIAMLDDVLAYRRIHKHNTTATASKNDFLKLIKTHLDEKRKSTRQ